MTKQELRERIAELEASSAEKDRRIEALAGEVCRLATCLPSATVTYPGFHPWPTTSPHWTAPYGGTATGIVHDDGTQWTYTQGGSGGAYVGACGGSVN